MKYANIPQGGSVAVVGLGPIGDMSTRVAFHMGAGKVIGLDLVPERLERARQNGVDAIDIRQFEGDNQKLAEAIRDRTNGRGADSVIEAVGMEAHGSPNAKMIQQMTTLMPDVVAEKVFTKAGIDRLFALYSAIEIVRRGGTISIVGVYAGQADPISLDTLFDRQIQLRMGQANAPFWTQEILPLLEEGNTFDVDNFTTHKLSLDEAPHAYEIFQKKEDNAIKIVLKP